MPKRRIVVDPVTRLEGHGKIDIVLDEAGEVERAYFQVPELRGFEAFAVGRPAEDMPQITSRICGVCPMAHHMASAKALDDLYGVEPPRPAKKVRELVYDMFLLEDHALHVYVLGGPDFLVGPEAPPADRNVLGVIRKAGPEAGRRVLAVRKRLRAFIAEVAGKAVHPVFGLPGGVSKGVSPAALPELRALAAESLDFARSTLGMFRDTVLKDPAYMEMITSDLYTHRTYYMGLVDDRRSLSFYDGRVRVVDPEGKEYATFQARDYRNYIAERAEPWTYMKFPYLKPVGWRGFTEGPESGVYAVAPMARLNVADGMSTPEAQKAYEELFGTLGRKPVHHTLANHWARVVEMVYAAERIGELSRDPEITSADLRVIPAGTPSVGYGVVEAPRGTLFHHYESDEQGLIRKANLVVATQNNAARIAMSVEKAAKGLVHKGQVSEGLLNRIEMAFRAYDPCHGCATHSLPGQMPLVARIHDADGRLVRELRR